MNSNQINFESGPKYKSQGPRSNKFDRISQLIDLKSTCS